MCFFLSNLNVYFLFVMLMFLNNLALLLFCRAWKIVLKLIFLSRIAFAISVKFVPTFVHKNDPKNTKAVNAVKFCDVCKAIYEFKTRSKSFLCSIKKLNY